MEINHVIKLPILIDGKHSFSYIAQSNYYIIEIFNLYFSKKKNIEIKDGCNFVKIITENLWEFLYTSGY